MQAADPYRRTQEDIREPPNTLRGILRYLGPGLIVTGSIVGSGELIMTTHLGAKIGLAVGAFLVVIFLWEFVLGPLFQVLVGLGILFLILLGVWKLVERGNDDDDDLDELKLSE